jgi:hypothetical protein
MIEQVAKNLFQISPQEMEELETDIGAAVPKLLAKTFVKVQHNFLSQMARLIPGMVQNVSQAQQRNAENERKFLSAWPALKEEHLPTVRNLAVQYRQMHPQASFDQMVADLGPIAMMQLRINPTAVAPAPAPSQPQPFVPAQPGPAAIVTQMDDDPWGLDPSKQTG